MKTYGLIGYPLGHSFSKKYFTEKFEKENIANCNYELYPIDEISKFPELIKSTPNICGINVTIPYKESVMQYLDELDDTAKGVGAVNCIKIVNDLNGSNKIQKQKKLIGYNTDAFGFKQSIKPFLESHHQRALILGTGGASKAVLYVLKQIGVECFYVSRSKKNNSNTLTYQELNENVIKSCKLIINASPIGTFPNIEDAPLIPYEFITPQHLLYDLVYNPAETEFLKRGKKQGATTINGLTMLIQQAEEAWRIWNT